MNDFSIETVSNGELSVHIHTDESTTSWNVEECGEATLVDMLALVESSFFESILDPRSTGSAIQVQCHRAAGRFAAGRRTSAGTIRLFKSDSALGLLLPVDCFRCFCRDMHRFPNFPLEIRMTDLERDQHVD